MAKLNPYIRIMEAAKAGRGVVLTAEECFYLAQDDAIEAVATRTVSGEPTEGGSYVIAREGFRPKAARPTNIPEGGER